MPAQLIVALDVPSVAEARVALRKLPAEALWIKVGLELYTAVGPAILRELCDSGKRVFLDLKLHDIPNTVSRAVSAACAHGVQMLTIHAAGGRAMIRAAADALHTAGNPELRLVAVTMLTSLGPDDMADLGIARTVPEQAATLGRLAMDCGAHGVVCSAHEATALRAQLGPDAILVTPGIRPAGGNAGDQKRVASPAMAVRAGATHLVVGRPIIDAPNPAEATHAILAEMAAADHDKRVFGGIQPFVVTP